MDISPKTTPSFPNKTPQHLKGKALVSIIIPFLNEQDTLAKLYTEITEVFFEINRPYEVLFIDDGSSDQSAEIVNALSENKPNIKVICFTRNFGKASAISAGIKEAQGSIIITMDADLQDDPTEIINFLSKMDEGFDYVSGWKFNRNDPLGKTLPSKIFNLITSKLFDIEIHDINCGFKAYSKRAADHLNLYGEMHRFTPAILQAAGYRGTEITVKHNAREYGQSKYGNMRMVKGLLDIFTVKMMTTYNARPLHFFAMLGLPLCLLGGLIISYLSMLWLLDLGPIGNRPLLLIGILLFVTGSQVLSVGLVAELLQSSRINEKDKYVIDKIIESTKQKSRK